MTKPYTLKSPCKDCPFRSDVKPYLSPARALEIMNESYEDSNFYCHKTVDYSCDDGEGKIADKSRVCAGYLVTMEREGRANQPTRIAERLGLYDRTQLDMNAPTYESMNDWVRSYSPTAEGDHSDLEHCNVASGQCIDPAGFVRGGAVFDNPHPPTCSQACTVCDSMVCAGCTDHLESVQNGEEKYRLPVCVYCV